MKRKLFCEISPLTYKISKYRWILKRNMENLHIKNFALSKNNIPLEYKIYSSASLIRRTLGNVDMKLQENKAKNLEIACKKLNGTLIKPNEIFSFWKLVGAVTAKKGYLEGLTINSGKTCKDIGGGLCQLTNIIHWVVLHTDLEIIEHHHHDGIDMFPDYGRIIPFGTGTSIMYNYFDYRFKNNSQNTYQLFLHTDEKYLYAQIRCDNENKISYHISSLNEHFEEHNNEVFRVGKVIRQAVDKKTGNIIKTEVIKENFAKILYDKKYVEDKIIR